MRLAEDCNASARADSSLLEECPSVYYKVDSQRVVLYALEEVGMVSRSWKLWQDWQGRRRYVEDYLFDYRMPGEPHRALLSCSSLSFIV